MWYGECVQSDRTVVLNPLTNTDEKEKWDSFIHEVLHAIDNYAEQAEVPGWHLPHAVINRLAGPLASFLIENGVTFREP